MRWDQKNKPLPPKDTARVFVKKAKINAPKPTAKAKKASPSRKEELVALLPDDPERFAASQIRRAAYLRYVTEPDLSIEELSKLEPFASRCTFPMMQRWSQTDEWAAGRKQQFDQIKASIMRHMATRQVQNHLETLTQVKAIKDRIVAQLATTDFEALPGDKLVKSLCLVIDTEMKLLGLTGGVLTPPTTATAGAMDGTNAPNDLTDEEARVVAAALMRQRREAREQQTSLPSPDPKPAE